MRRDRTDETNAAAAPSEDVRAEAAAPRHSRRALIGGAVAAAGAGIAGAVLASAAPAGAATESDGSPLILGQVNQATDTTGLQNTNGPCLEISSTSGSDLLVVTDNSGAGVNGVSGYTTTGTGVLGVSTSNTGVLGLSTSGVGVAGQSNSSYGVEGTTGVPDATQTGAAAVLGNDQSNAGSIGVWGSSINGVGVSGESNAGDGVDGQTSGDFASGVRATDNSNGGGYGVSAYTNSGIALFANASTPTATALQIFGPSQFSTAGKATIPKGKKSVVVDVSFVVAGDFVLATMQEFVSGEYVAAAVAGNGTVTIYLNAAPTAARTVAYFVISPFTELAARPKG
jgi:hypothetical protein